MSPLKHRYQVVIPSFNSVQWLEKTLESVAQQGVSHFDVCIIDDASTIPEQKVLIDRYCEKYGWKAIFHTENKGALAGIVEGIESLQPRDEDVIVTIDGDDWLAHDNVFATLDAVYSDDVLLSWGQFEVSPKGWLPIRYAQPVTQEVIDKQLYREIPWVFWPLRTFKYHLWKKIDHADLKDCNGDYYRVSWDQAFMLPMLEMAGERIHFVDEVLYVYNIDNPLNDFKISRDEQEEATAEIRSKKKYKRL